MRKIYNSWLKRTSNIDIDCVYCCNERYFFKNNYNSLKSTIYACPVCNFEDLQITKETNTLPLHKFVLVKKGDLSISEL